MAALHVEEKVRRLHSRRVRVVLATLNQDRMQESPATRCRSSCARKNLRSEERNSSADEGAQSQLSGAVRSLHSRRHIKYGPPQGKPQSGLAVSPARRREPRHCKREKGHERGQIDCAKCRPLRDSTSTILPRGEMAATGVSIGNESGTRVEAGAVNAIEGHGGGGEDVAAPTRERGARRRR